MSESDLVKLFDEIMLFENSVSLNKDWMDGVSRNKYPSFNRFKLTKADKVYLRVTAQENIRQSLILAKNKGHNQFEYVTGSFEPNSKTVSVDIKLDEGEYIVAVFHEWVLKNAGQYSVFLTSTSLTDFTRVADSHYSNFLENIFLNYSLNNQDKRENVFHAEKSTYSVFSIQEIGYGFLHLKTKNIKKDTVKVMINEE